MEEILEHGEWASLTTIANEPHLLVKKIDRTPTREKIWKPDPQTKADNRGKYWNPTLSIVMDVEVQEQSGLGSLGVGQAVSAGLTNFDTVWREHDPDDGIVVLDDVKDSSDAEGDEPLTSTMTFLHKPFVVVAGP